MNFDTCIHASAISYSFCLQNYDRIMLERDFSQNLTYLDIIASKHYCRFAGCTCIMRLSHSTTSHRCSIGLRSGYCGGYLNTVNPLHVPISGGLSFVTWSIVLLGLAVRRWVQCIHKRMDMVSANTQVGCGI